MTPEEKANEYLEEFSIEKSIDLAETMLEVSEGIPSPDLPPEYWRSVLKILHETDEKVICRSCGGSGRQMVFKNDEHQFDEYESCYECFGLGVTYENKNNDRTN